MSLCLSTFSFTPFYILFLPYYLLFPLISRFFLSLLSLLLRKFLRMFNRHVTILCIDLHAAHMKLCYLSFEKKVIMLSYVSNIFEMTSSYWSIRHLYSYSSDLKLFLSLQESLNDMIIFFAYLCDSLLLLSELSC